MIQSGERDSLDLDCGIQVKSSQVKLVKSSQVSPIKSISKAVFASAPSGPPYRIK